MSGLWYAHPSVGKREFCPGRMVPVPSYETFQKPTANPAALRGVSGPHQFVYYESLLYVLLLSFLQ